MINLNLLGARLSFDVSLGDGYEYTLNIISRIHIQTYIRDVKKEGDYIEIDIRELLTNMKRVLPFEVRDIRLYNTQCGPLVKMESEIPLRDFNKHFKEDIYEYLHCKCISKEGYTLILGSALRPTLRERDFDLVGNRSRRRVDEIDEIDDSEVFEEV